MTKRSRDADDLLVAVPAKRARDPPPLPALPTEMWHAILDAVFAAEGVRGVYWLSVLSGEWRYALVIPHLRSLQCRRMLVPGWAVARNATTLRGHPLQGGGLVTKYVRVTIGRAELVGVDPSLRMALCRIAEESRESRGA